jgi:2-C-methyl-D-erythritol 4-phosphate cytidylyltransferase
MITGIVVAAGRGVRMNQRIRKQYLTMEGRPILCHTLEALDACGIINALFLVVPKEDFDFCHRNILSPSTLAGKVTLIAGGNERQDSVYNGLKAIEDKDGIVVIHDGVRPFVRAEPLRVCIDGARDIGACILGIPASDTVKHVTPSGYINRTLDREDLWLVQTPQVFQYRIIREAHEVARQRRSMGTDDALLVERIGYKVKIVAGDRYNLKITTPEDLAVATAILRYKSRESP